MELLGGAFFKLRFGPFALLHFLFEKLVCLTQFGCALRHFRLEAKSLLADGVQPPFEPSCNEHYQSHNQYPNEPPCLPNRWCDDDRDRNTGIVPCAIAIGC